MQVYNGFRTSASAKKQTLFFIKEERIWYADLPEFLKPAIGSKGNLMREEGADSFQNLLSYDGEHSTLNISTKTFKGYSGRIK